MYFRALHVLVVPGHGGPTIPSSSSRLTKLCGDAAGGLLPQLETGRNQSPSQLSSEDQKGLRKTRTCCYLGLRMAHFQDPCADVCRAGTRRWKGSVSRNVTACCGREEMQRDQSINIYIYIIIIIYVYIYIYIYIHIHIYLRVDGHMLHLHGGRLWERRL